ncbi:DUF6246 family protein [Yersinia kristensenii]|uniref:DUF6246 family protein n=1 Tax=Yersinia kristensenii TaxID=28152 RepID=UPI0011A6B73A|nr:DUF6246 family protein [Yersinia kristensenii]
MTPLKEIGEALISDDKRDYFFRPSFVNMAKIGEPKEIVETFAELHDSSDAELVSRELIRISTQNQWLRAIYSVETGEEDNPYWLIQYLMSDIRSKGIVMSAMNVLQACCDKDLKPIIGELRPSKRGKKAFTYLAGSMPLSDMIVIARSLITHGIIGKAKVRKLQRHESNSYVNEFSAFEYISAARNHFNMPRAEAEQLSMTEFQLLLNAKYPDQKGFTKEEYDSVADDYFARKQAKLAKAA